MVIHLWMILAAVFPFVGYVILKDAKNDRS